MDVVTDEKLLSHIFFLLVFPVPALLFGGDCLFVAYQTWTSLSVKIVQRISLIIAIVLVILVIAYPCSILRGSIWFNLTSPLLIIMGGIFYSVCNKVLKKWFCLKETIDWNRHAKSTRRFLGWVAFFMLGACANLIMDLTSKGSEYEHVLDQWWGILIVLLAPVIIIFLLYKACIHIALRKKPADIKVNNN